MFKREQSAYGPQTKLSLKSEKAVLPKEEETSGADLNLELPNAGTTSPMGVSGSRALPAQPWAVLSPIPAVLCLPMTAALRTGCGAALLQEAPLGVAHLCTALSAKNAYCSAWACPEPSSTWNSSRSLRTPSAKGFSVAARTAWKHSSGARNPRACFFTFTRASRRNASILGSLGTGLRLSRRGPRG